MEDYGYTLEDIDEGAEKPYTPERAAEIAELMEDITALADGLFA